jgi:hypothetical protein
MTPSITIPAIEPGPTAPPRGRYARARRHKFATFVTFLVAFALLVRLVWGWQSGRQVRAAMDDLRRRGQPIAAGESVDPLPPSDDNAWPFYAKAILALKPNVDSPRNSIIEYPSYAPYGTQWEALAAASEKANAPAFPAARQARRFNRAQFPPANNLGGQSLRPEWNGARYLANTLGDGAQYAHLHGDDAEAVERLLDVVHLGRSVRQDPSLVGQLVGIGVEALACDAVQHVAPTLRLDRSAGGTPASAEQARQLIAALLDDKDDRACLARALARERGGILSAMNATAEETWAIRPLADRTTVRWLQVFDSLVDAAEHKSGAEARKLTASMPGPGSPNPLVSFPALGPEQVVRYSRWFESFGPQNLARSIEQFHRVSAERRATAFIVAARLYRQDHGHWPDDAAALVPDYLDALPADPFREDGGPLGYVLKKGALPDGGDRPLVYYEAGEPGADRIDTEPMYSWQVDWNRKLGTPRREIRQYRDVSYWLPKVRRFDAARNPPTTASTQAVGNYPNKPDAPGDDAQDGDASDRPPKQ